MLNKGKTFFEVSMEKTFCRPIPRLTWLAVMLWGLIALGSFVHYHQQVKTLNIVQEMALKVDEMRNNFFYEPSYRLQKVDELSLQLQMVYTFRLQLEAFQRQQILSPDLSQLIYVSDRFIEDARQFLEVELAVSDFANDMIKIRQTTESEALANSLFQLSALVFESMYSSVNNNSDIYKGIDQLFIESKQLPAKEAETLQIQLAHASNVLSAFAQGKHLVDKLYHHSLHGLIASLEDQLQNNLLNYFWLHLFSGFVTIGFIFLSHWRALRQPPCETAVIQESVEAANEAEIPNSVEKTAAESVFATVTKSVVESPDQDSVSQIKTTVENAVALPKEEAGQGIDLTYMLESLSGDKESVQMLLKVFVHDHQGDIDKLREALDTDVKLAMRVAHSLKGVASSVGARTLHAHAALVEKKLKQGQSVSEIDVQRFDELLAMTIQSAKDVVNGR